MLKKIMTCYFIESAVYIILNWAALQGRALFLYTHASLALYAVLSAMAITVALLALHIRLLDNKKLNSLDIVLRVLYCASVFLNTIFLVLTYKTPSWHFETCRNIRLALFLAFLIFLLLLYLHETRRSGEKN